MKIIKNKIINLIAASTLYFGLTTAQAQDTTNVEQPDTNIVDTTTVVQQDTNYVDTALEGLDTTIEDTLAIADTSIENDTTSVLSDTTVSEASQEESIDSKFPLDFSNYERPDSAAIAGTKFFDTILEKIATYDDQLSFLEEEIAGLFEVTDTQKYSLKTNLVDDNGLLYLTHQRADNAQINLSQAANHLGVTEDKIIEFAVKFLNNKGIEADTSEITWDLDEETGEYTDIYRNNLHIGVNPADEVPFSTNFVSTAIASYFNVLDSWKEMLSNKETSDVVANLEILENSIIETEAMIDSATIDNSLTEEEYVSIEETARVVRDEYNNMLEGLMKSLTSDDFKLVSDSYDQFTLNTMKFLNMASEQLNPTEKLVAEEKESRETFKKVANYLKSFNSANLELNGQKLINSRNYARLGVGLENENGTSINFGVLAHYSRDKTENPETTVNLPDGSVLYGQDSFSEEANGFGGFASIKKKLGRNVGFGVEYIFLPVDVDKVRTKTEGQRFPDGLEKEVSTTKLMFEEDYINALGVTGTLRLPFGQKGELTLTPGWFYNTKTEETFTGYNIGFSVNLNGE